MKYFIFSIAKLLIIKIIIGRAIFIVYVTCGMDKVEKLYGTALKSIQIEDDNETFENKQFKFIYIHLKRIHDLKKMDEIALLNDIELNKWGQQFEVIPKKMLCNSKVCKHFILKRNIYFF